MTDSAIIAIAAAISIAFSTIGPAMGQGKTAAAAMESIARQPDAAGAATTQLDALSNALNTSPKTLLFIPQNTAIPLSNLLHELYVLYRV